LSAARVRIVLGGPAHGALDALVAATVSGATDAGGEVAVERADAPGLRDRLLADDALVLAAPVVLFGLPADLKALLDSFLDVTPPARLTARTTRMRAGYLFVFHPFDPAAPDLLHRHVQAVLRFLGMDFRGRAGGFAPPGAAAPADASQLAVAERLGRVLCGEEGFAGWRDEYLRGVARFNAGEFWEAHEEWEAVWLEEESELRLCYQGLIQVAGAFHHYRRGNWAGMAALLREGTEKLARFRPRALGLDLEALLAELGPWRALAAARAGGRGAVRDPGTPPRLEPDDPGDG